ncbi:hypothetical protein J2R98_000660 [Alkalibacillus filiformis]|uniref:Transposase n=2 Tax=Alkalibacillus filiformis TaxID=200990 RepID=A0ABU0DQY9_9BACI|nr:hypothetical protein [Alkalibacillus filiformis]
MTLPGLESFQVIGTRDENGFYHIYVERPREMTPCPDCQTSHCDKSELLTDDYLIKEWFCDWFDQVKDLGANHLKEIKANLYGFYDTVKQSEIPELNQAIKTL